MEDRRIYEDIALRTDGDIYIGVVGPVRTGKSTFIKRFMETLVLPNIGNIYSQERAKDELPQSGSGRTIMTAEPKFVPEEAVKLRLGEAELSVRLIDCVGYMVDGAIGQTENDMPRMVNTPWYDYEIPMSEAAEIGTRKVIAEHSTIGIVVTTDGSITDIPRESYIDAENRVISELKEINKPFIVIVNTISPSSDRAFKVKEEIEKRHQVTCVITNCMTMNEGDVNGILRGVLYEFPVSEIGVFLPAWVESLPHNHKIKNELFSAMRSSSKDIRRIYDIEKSIDSLKGNDMISSANIDSINLGNGSAIAKLDLHRKLFYDTMSDQTGLAINDDGDLLSTLMNMAQVKVEYDKIAEALKEVRETGYGVVMPTADELKLEEPEIVKHGGRYGIKLRASAPSIHMIRADIETEVSPIVGSEKQSEELINYLLSEFEGDTGKIWQSYIFGKSLHELVSEGLHTKIKRMPEDARVKFRDTLEKIINEGNGGLICIIL